MIEATVSRDCPHIYGIMGDPIWCLEEDGNDRCDRCWNRTVSEESPTSDKRYNPIQKAYDRLVDYRDACLRDHIALYLDDVIGYLGEALDEHPEDSIEEIACMNPEHVAMPVIKDSGDRTQFESGAVRDMREGKGRCDLTPLAVVYHYLKLFFDEELARPIKCIWGFQECGDTRALYEAINLFLLSNNEWDSAPTMFLEVAKHFEEGAKKYGEMNWQLGIPTKCYIDSAVRHYLKWLRGDKDEFHCRAFCWNLMCCIWEVDYHKKEDEE